MQPERSRFSSERGAIIIQVAAALLALTAFSAIVLDYGVLWSSRGQAQTAADSGALAGAISLEFLPDDPAVARTAAGAAAGQNNIWGQYTSTSDMVISLPITCPPGPYASLAPGCVRVDVNRGTTDRNSVSHTNTLPTFFANLLGINSQAISATATAEIVAGNAVRCIKPWIVADKWVDNDEAPIGGWAQTDTFNPPTDTYSPSTGFNPTNDTGLELALKPGTVGTWSAGWVQEIDFPGCSGSSCYTQEIAGCPNWVPTVALYDPAYPCSAKGDTPDPAHGCVDVKTGVSQGPTSSGVDNLVALDPSSYWDSGTNSPQGGCMATNSCTNADGPNISPRIVPIALFNTLAYYNEATASGCNGTGCVAQVVNLVGFFIEGMCDEVYPGGTQPAYCGTTSQAKKTVLGRLMRYPGQLLGTGGTTTSSFAKTVILVR
jgi:hypothetical protein